MSQETCRRNLGAEAGGAPRIGAPARRGRPLSRVPRVVRVEPCEVTVRVCTTCRAEGEAVEPRAGARLYAALSAARGEGDPQIAGVECFSVCKRPCTLSFSAPGAWTYVYGDFPPETDPQAILAAAKLYAASPQGLIPWRERPTALKKGVVARLPPMEPA